MCSLLVLRGLDEDHPLIVAANRDERRSRPSSPPGLWHGERHRVLSPRDRQAGGTWLAVDQRCRVAAITNLSTTAPVPDAPSRGHLPHLALDHDDLGRAAQVIGDLARASRYGGFQLVLADADRILVVRHHDGEVRHYEWSSPTLQLSNEHAPGDLSLRHLPPVLAAGLPLERRLELARRVLLDPGGDGAHAVLKRGEHYGTVSSSLLAVPRRDPTGLVWRYAAGSPDVVPYRNYGNLGGHLVAAPGG